MNNFYKLGVDVENTFSKSLQAYLSLKTTMEVDVSALAEDEDLGIDLRVACSMKIDVKSAKKLNRSDDTLSNYTWIEFLNVKGEKGWLYREATHFAFEDPIYPCFWVISKKPLKEYSESKVKTKERSDKPEEGKLYTRPGRKDVLTIIPFQWIRENCDFMVPKVE